MAVKASFEKLTDNRVKLAVEVTPDELAAAIERAYKKLSREVRIDGFRKGKAPRHIIEQHLGHEPAFAEALDAMTGTWYLEAVSITGIEPTDTPNIDFADQTIEELKTAVLSFTAEVDVIPEIVLADYVGLEIGRMDEAVTEDDIKHQIDQLLQRFAKLEVIEDRPLAKGDFAQLDYVGYLDGKEMNGTRASDHMVEVGAGTLLDDFENNLPGMEKGETREFDVNFPLEYGSPEVAGKTLHFEVTLKEIKVRHMPEMDDDFAKEVGFDSLDELRENITNDLTKMKKERVEATFKRDVLDAVVEQMDIPLPESMINIRAEELFRELIQSLSQQGASLDEYCAAVGRQPVDIATDAQAEAGIQLRNELVLDAIAEAEAMEITEEELMEELNENSARIGETAEVLRQRIIDNGTESQLKQSMLRQKAITYLVEKAIPGEWKEPEPVKNEEAAAKEETARTEPAEAPAPVADETTEN